MNILYMRTEFYSPTTSGGLMSFAQGILGGMKSLGHNFSVLASAKMPVVGADKEYYLPYNNFLLDIPEVYHLAYNEKVFPFIKDVIRNNNFDFVYLRHSAFNYIGALIKKQLGVKVILQVDSSEVWVKKNWGTTYLNRPLELAEKIQFEHCDAMAVFSSVLKNKFVKEGISSNKIFIVPSAVNPTVFNNNFEQSNLKGKYKLENSFIIGFAGSFGSFHGVEVLAKAFKYVVQKIPNAKLLLVGDGDTRGNVENILNDDNIRDKVIITGMLPLFDVPEHLSICDLLILPSVNNSDGSEFFCSPIKLFEYMSMAKPIVASAIGQIKEVINEGYNGFLTNENDPISLANKIIEVYNRNDLTNIGLNARKDVLQNFSWEASAQRVIDIANQIK